MNIINVNNWVFWFYNHHQLVLECEPQTASVFVVSERQRLLSRNTTVRRSTDAIAARLGKRTNIWSRFHSFSSPAPHGSRTLRSASFLWSTSPWKTTKREWCYWSRICASSSLNDPELISDLPQSVSSVQRHIHFISTSISWQDEHTLHLHSTNCSDFDPEGQKTLEH